MSFARFSNSDVYMFPSTSESAGNGWECQRCPLGPRHLPGGPWLPWGPGEGRPETAHSFFTPSLTVFIAHVNEHRAAGHRVNDSPGEPIEDELRHWDQVENDGWGEP